ncbi:MAG: hypothetical protein ABJB97_06805, partial [Acidobacteriota bacterium]
MRNKSLPLMLLVLFISIFTANRAAFAQAYGAGTALKPPMAEKKTKTTKIHGDTMVDDYFWLREKTNPQVIAHLEAENAYTDAVMKP